MGDMAELYDYLLDEPEPMDVGDLCPDSEWNECNGKMVLRTNRRTGEQFVGCSQYPKCKQTAPMRLRAAREE